MSAPIPTTRKASAVAPLDSRERLKLVACRLFAERGIDGVTVRDIVAAGGQRNAAAIYYHFGPKEALVRELVVDGARRIDNRRNAALDELERQSTPPTLRQIIDSLIRTAFPSPGEIDDQTYLRFIALLNTNHRDLFLDAIGKRWNRGYKRALAHIRRLLPDVAPEILTQRLIFMGLHLGATLAAREGALDNPKRKKSSWSGELVIENLADTIEVMLRAEPTASTLAAYQALQPTARRVRKVKP
ncbi:MAG: TetR family transcriptional regulator [Sulfuricaulis sp.]|nr:TetR family transcriptional regulator [Sulfuricaulis sp.]